MSKEEKRLRLGAVAAGELLALVTGIAVLLRKLGGGLFPVVSTAALLLAPELIERLFQCRLSPGLYVFGVVYALGPMLGSCWKFYYTVPGWDKLLHLCGGVMFAVLGGWLFRWMSGGQVCRSAELIFALCFSVAVAAVWEFAEYGADLFLGTDMQKDTVVDFITSYRLGTEPGELKTIGEIGATVVDGRPLPVEGYLDIGLHDSMKDMMLESLGALVTALVCCTGRGRLPICGREHSRKGA